MLGHYFYYTRRPQKPLLVMTLKPAMPGSLHAVQEVSLAVHVQTRMPRRAVRRTELTCAVMGEGQTVWMVLVISQTAGKPRYVTAPGV